MVDTINPAANNAYMPFFITPPGSQDTLMIAMAVFILAAIIGIGLIYFRLHALPEQMAHRGKKVQFQIVAVLALLALFTHNHVYWIAGLMLALIDFPDFSTPIASMARSLDWMAGRRGKPLSEEANLKVTTPDPGHLPETIGAPNDHRG